MSYEIDTYSTNSDYNDLSQIRDSIEAMNKFNQVEILRLLHHRKTVILNENKYGVHINLSELDKESLDCLKYYIEYVNNQESTLNEIEKQKESFKNIYFSKDNKDNKQ